ncbi:MAG: glycerophosphoryl diester phosphodiesterase membrane domain-containing protein [Mycobacterium sp.]
MTPPPPALKPGVIPLRPLDLSSLYNGAIEAIRANPKATIGLTAVVVFISQLVTFALQAGPIAGLLSGAAGFNRNSNDAFTAAFGVGFVGGALVGFVIAFLATIVLSGMLTVTIGRSVFGERTTPKEAWHRAKPRIWALVGLAFLSALVLAVPFALGVAVVVGLALSVGPLGAVPAGFVLAFTYLALYLYFVPVFALASPVLILERQRVFGALGRSISLVRKGFWRLLGILILTAIIVSFVAGILGIPFSIVGQVAMSTGTQNSSGTSMIIGLALTTIGTIIAQIITLPFNAAVNVLLYTDQRMRSEAFDLVLQTETRTRERLGQPGVDADTLWLPTPPPAQM